MWIKICGITRSEDALSLWRLGVDAIGLNFFEGSRRFVDPHTARLIVQQLLNSTPAAGTDGAAVHGCADDARPFPDIVGVFVNATAEHVASTCDRVGLTAVQFHGDETAEDLREFHDRRPDIPVIRAVRCSRRNIDAILTSLEQLIVQVPIAAVLLDALVTGEYGGTGHTVDPFVVRACQSHGALPPLILAGGLTPANVATAVSSFQPWGIDTASGVENAPGIKDQSLVEAFLKAARADHTMSPVACPPRRLSGDRRS